MKPLSALVLSGAVALASALPALARADAASQTAADAGGSQPATICTLGKVKVASLDGRPGMKLFLDGAVAFRKGDFRHAVYMYKVAASWADKAAEYDLGLMYFRGEGVAVDRPLGAAWMVLAAERGKPLYVHARDLMITSLTDAQFERMNELWSGLSETYGDKVALHRAKSYLAAIQAQDNVGSHLPDGFGGMVHSATFGQNGSLNLLAGGPGVDSFDDWQKSKTDKPYDPSFVKMSCPTGTVKVEPLQQVKTDDNRSVKPGHSHGSSNNASHDPGSD